MQTADRQNVEIIDDFRRPLNGTHNMTRGIKILSSPLSEAFHIGQLQKFCNSWPPSLWIWCMETLILFARGWPASADRRHMWPAPRFVPSPQGRGRRGISYWSLIHEVIARTERQPATRGIAQQGVLLLVCTEIFWLWMNNSTIRITIIRIYSLERLRCQNIGFYCVSCDLLSASIEVDKFFLAHWWTDLAQ